MASPLHTSTNTSEIHGVVLANSAEVSNGHDETTYSSTSVPFSSTTCTKAPAGTSKANAQISGPALENIPRDLLENCPAAGQASRKKRRLFENVRRKIDHLFRAGGWGWVLKQVDDAENELFRGNITNFNLSADNTSVADGLPDPGEPHVPGKRSKKQKRRELKQLRQTIVKIDHSTAEETREERKERNRKGHDRINRGFVVTRPRGRQYRDWAKRRLSRKMGHLSRGTLAYTQPEPLPIPVVTDMLSEHIRMSGEGDLLGYEIPAEPVVTPRSADLRQPPVSISRSIPLDPALYDLVGDIELAPPLESSDFDYSNSFDCSCTLQDATTNLPATDPPNWEHALNMDPPDSRQQEVSFMCRVHVLKSCDALRAAINAYNYRGAQADDPEPLVLWTDASISEEQMAAAFVYRLSTLNSRFQTKMKWVTRGFAIRGFGRCTTLAEMIGVEEALKCAIQQLPHATTTMDLSGANDTGYGDPHTDRQMSNEVESCDGTGRQEFDYESSSPGFEPLYNTFDQALCSDTHSSCIEQFPFPHTNPHGSYHEMNIEHGLQRCPPITDRRMTTDSQGEWLECQGLNGFSPSLTSSQLPPLYNKQARDELDVSSEQVYEVLVQGPRQAGHGVIPGTKTPFNSVHVYTDCVSVLEALLAGGSRARPRHEAVMRINALIFHLGTQGVQVEMHWVPAHSGVEGNEKADEVANKVRKSLEKSRPSALPTVNNNPELTVGCHDEASGSSRQYERLG